MFRTFFHLLFLSSLLIVSHLHAQPIATLPKEATMLFEKGKTALAQQEFDVALRQFKLLEWKYPDHPYQEQVTYFIVVCLNNTHQYQEAIRATKSFVKNYPNSQQLDSVLQFQKDSIQKRNRAVLRAVLKEGLLIVAVGGAGIALFYNNTFFAGFRDNDLPKSRKPPASDFRSFQEEIKSQWQKSHIPDKNLADWLIKQEQKSA